MQKRNSILYPSIHLQQQRLFMNSIVYIVGLVVIVIAALSFFGLR